MGDGVDENELGYWVGREGCEGGGEEVGEGGEGGNVVFFGIVIWL